MTCLLLEVLTIADVDGGITNIDIQKLDNFQEKKMHIKNKKTKKTKKNKKQKNTKNKNLFLLSHTFFIYNIYLETMILYIIVYNVSSTKN